MNTFTRIIVHLLIIVILTIGLAYPFGQIYKEIVGHVGNIFLSGSAAETIAGMVLSFVFAVIFSFNLLKTKSKFIWMVILVAIPFWIILNDPSLRWWYPISLIIAAFVLSELTKYLLRLRKKPI